MGSKRVIACADVELLEVEEVYWIKRCAAISCSQSSAFIHILLFFRDNDMKEREQKK